jgi:glycosyltransferase involved in cell wall biosynthesis
VTERVSVLICTYNHGRYLEQCLSSVLNQTRPPDEVIVVNDGSTDGTLEVMKQFPQVLCIHQQNTGKAVAFGRAFSLSTGDIICHLDADDYWDLHKLERVMRCFEANPNLGGVLHEVTHVDASGNVIQFPWSIKQPGRPTTLTLAESEDVGFLYPLPGARGRFFGVPGTTCVRRRFLADLLPLEPGIGGSVDGIFIAAALRYGASYLPEALGAYRIHGSNTGFGNVASTQQTICMWEFLLAHRNFRPSLSDRHARLLRAKILERKAYMASRTGRKVLAGAWAGIRVPWILATSGYRCSWKHLALPVVCFLPVKRTRGRAPQKGENSVERKTPNPSAAAVQR